MPLPWTSRGLGGLGGLGGSGARRDHPAAPVPARHSSRAGPSLQGITRYPRHSSRAGPSLQGITRYSRHSSRAGPSPQGITRYPRHSSRAGPGPQGITRCPRAGSGARGAQGLRGSEARGSRLGDRGSGLGGSGARRPGARGLAARGLAARGLAARGSGAEACAVLDPVDLPGGSEAQQKLRRAGAMLTRLGAKPPASGRPDARPPLRPWRCAAPAGGPPPRPSPGRRPTDLGTTASKWPRNP
jgi:hypothetical protein